MKQKLAVITGADGGMGMEITRAVAAAGYKVIMACRDPEIAEEKRQLIMRETGNIALEIVPVNLASLSSTASFANELLQRGEVITLLMNNAGTMETRRCITEDGLERTVSVNYVAPYLLTRKLLPLMGEGSLHLTALGVREELSTVADAEYRNAADKLAQIYLESFRIMNGIRATAQDDTNDRWVILWKLVVRHDLAEGIEFTDTTADELCGL